MVAGKYDFTIEVGSDFSHTFRVLDDGVVRNLTGYSAEIDIKSSPSGSVLLTLSSSNGRISLGGTAGTISLTVEDTVTSTITASEAVYDLLLTSGAGLKTRLLQGSVFFSAQITS